MEASALHTGTPTVNWEENTSFIFVVEAKIVTPRVKKMYIPIYFIQKMVYNGLFIPKYEKSSVMPVYMCTKSCSGPIIGWSTK